MEVSVSSSQRNLEAAANSRAEANRLEKSPHGDAFSRHLDETRREPRGSGRDSSADMAQIREDRTREDRMREERRMEARAADRRDADRRRTERQDDERPRKADGASNAQSEPAPQTASETDVMDIPAGDGEGAAPPAQQEAQPDTASEKKTDVKENAETAPRDGEKPAAETAQVQGTGAEGGKAEAPATGQTAAASAKAGKTAATQSQLQAAAQTPQPAAASAQQQNQQNAQPAAAAGTATQVSGAGAENALAADTETGGDTLPGKQGKGLGKLAAEKLGAKENGTGEPFKPAASPAETAQRSAPAGAGQPAAAPPAVPGLAGFGLIGTDLPLNVSFDGGETNALRLEPASLGSSAQNNNPVMVRFGALPGQAQATQVPATTIAMQIARHAQNGVNTFEIRIDPPELGRVNVKLEMSDGRVNAHLVVEKPETLDLLQRDARALQQALRDAGLDVGKDALNFSLSGGGAEGSGGNDREASGETASGTPEDGAEQEAAATHYRLSLSSNGGIDIRV